MDYLILVLAVVSYAGGIVAQTVAAQQTEQRTGLDVGLLARLAGNPMFLLGFGMQVLGFGLCFGARATLPLYLVQGGVTCAVGLAAFIGFVVFGWRVRVAEIVALGVMVAGVALLAGAAKPSVVGSEPPGFALSLVMALVAVTVLAVPALRQIGGRSAVFLGSLSGAAFGVLALASRVIAGDDFLRWPLPPLVWVVVVAALVGQGLLTPALQRGSTTAVTGPMDAVTVVMASVIGVFVLGDGIVVGRSGWVWLGLLLVVGAVAAIAALAGGGGPDRHGVLPKRARGQVGPGLRRLR